MPTKKNAVYAWLILVLAVAAAGVTAITLQTGSAYTQQKPGDDGR